ncbi:MAG: DUF1572 family protein [bacterium]|nr:DUF1572 family protein [bacterium]
MKTSPEKLFLMTSAEFLREFYGKIDEAVNRLDESQLWARPNAASNSIGNLLLHLAGNVRQHIISGCGGAPDVRARSQEFAAIEGGTRTVLLANLKQTVEEACAVLQTLDTAALLEKRIIQGNDVLLLRDIYHVVEHFSYHTGQIVMRAKEMSGKGFGWYQHLEGT